jgi:hypothetical protein
MEETGKPGRVRRWIGGASLALGGLAIGAVIAFAASANADPSPSPSSATGNHQAPPGDRGGTRDESKSQRPDEHLLTGTAADKARAAALAKYPGATIQRVETDSDGVYEAHLITKDGKRVTVEMDKNFKVTGTETAPGAPR